ncbi:MAG: AAA-like domain-containing protein [Cyanobacteria bacterium P01_G01_bin.67]
MFSSSQQVKRKRGVIISSEGWQRLNSAQKTSEKKHNQSIPYTLEDLNELTGLSAHTLTKVRRRQSPVDKQTLECFFKAFDLELTEQDYTKPTLKTQVAVTQVQDSESNNNSRILTQPSEPLLPEGQVPLNSKFYVERSPIIKTCYKTILQPGSLIRIKAPRRMGKSSLMVRILDHAAQQDCQTVFLSFQLAERSILKDLDKFLQWFSASVGLGMHLPNRLEGYWDELFGSKISCKIYFEQYLLAKTTQPLILALDDVDRLFDYPELADEFFGLLRTWHEQAKNQNIWNKLRLIVAHSTEVYLPLNVNKSPFNVGLPVELKPFTPQQVNYLAQQYHLDWSGQKTEQLMALVNGQPYLIQMGLYSLWQEDISLTELLQQAVTDTGIFADHFRRLLWALRQDMRLCQAFAKVVQASTSVELELLSAFKLESLGLVRLLGNQALPSCELYTKYFRDRLTNFAAS